MTKVGDIELITSSQDLSSLIERCLKQDAYAIDTEFHREKSYYPRLALIQINFGKGVALVDPTIIAVSPLKELIKIEQDKNVITIIKLAIKKIDNKKP